jgi:chromosome segregation ATPase
MKYLRIVLFILLGLSLGLGGMYLKLRSERTSFQSEIDGLNRRIALVQKKYSEEKARVAGLLRTKVGLEGKIRALQTDVTKLQKANNDLVAERDALKHTQGKKALALKTKLENLKEKYKQRVKEQKDLKARHAKAEKAVKELTREKQRLESDLQQEKQMVRRYVSHNERLAEIATELVDRYRNKKAITSALEKEPFTGIKKVEMEKLLQEYEDRIDDHKLDEQEG